MQNLREGRRAVPIAGITPANKKFSVVIRLLDERIASETNRFDFFAI
jgi:hypothetical protein